MQIGTITYSFRGMPGTAEDILKFGSIGDGSMTDHHKIMIGFHNHTQMTPTTHDGPILSYGQGDTPVALVLQLLKREKWDIPADIELEYPVPQDSDPVAETTRCVQFCKNALA